MIFDFDDFGYDHIISDACQAHDCRDALLVLKDANPLFKVTLFTIPEYVNAELLSWLYENQDWVEWAVHGFTHSSNYECEKMSYDEFDAMMKKYRPELHGFAKLFKAPGWQISDDCYRWLADHGWAVADQSYNNDRRPKELPAYVWYDGQKQMKVGETAIPAWHGHTWNCVGNGIYETINELENMVEEGEEFKTVTEVLNA